MTRPLSEAQLRWVEKPINVDRHDLRPKRGDWEAEDRDHIQRELARLRAESGTKKAER